MVTISRNRPRLVRTCKIAAIISFTFLKALDEVISNLGRKFFFLGKFLKDMDEWMETRVRTLTFQAQIACTQDSFYTKYLEHLDKISMHIFPVKTLQHVPSVMLITTDH